MKIDILTLFPDMFAPLEHSIVGKAKDKGLLEINYHNFRENAEKAKEILASMDEPVYEVGEITEGNQDVVVTGGLFNE